LDVAGMTYFRPNGSDQTKLLVQDQLSGTAMRLYTDALAGSPYDLILGTYPNGHFDQIFLKQSNGFVGMGTNAPSSKLHVNGQITMADGSQGDGKILVSNSGGTSTWKKGSSYAYFYPTASSASNVSPTAVMMPGLNYTYTKLEAATTLEIDFIGHMSCNGVPGGAGVILEIMVDGVNCTSFSGRATYWSSDAPNPTNIVARGIAENLPTGNHTIQIWVYTSSGTTTSVFVNPGNWTDQIIVKETR
jgi:hypothetical protein